jgi:hypothetical protein
MSLQLYVCRGGPVSVSSWLMQRLFPLQLEKVWALGQVGLLRRAALT